MSRCVVAAVAWALLLDCVEVDSDAAIYQL
jgi:hypothetical protein